MNEFVQFFSFFWEEDLELVIAATIFSILCFIFAFLFTPWYLMLADWYLERRKRKQLHRRKKPA